MGSVAWGNEVGLFGSLAGRGGYCLGVAYQQSQKLFADSAVEAECPVPERYLTADAEL